MTNLKVNDVFPNAQLIDHRQRVRQIAEFTRPGEIDRVIGLDDGYPLIVVFYRGFFCPRDQQQMRHLVAFQDELAVNFCKLVAIAVQPPIVQAAFSAGLGAKWTFLCDTERTLIRQIGILDETEGEYADTSQPFTFVLHPDLRIASIYNGWYFVGRPTLDELRRDVRGVMEQQSYYPYEAWNVDSVKQVRIPQSTWAHGEVPLGASGHEVITGVVTSFDLGTGNGSIQPDGGDEAIFFNFTAIPGEGYRTISARTRVQCEVVTSGTRRTARNIRTI